MSELKGVSQVALKGRFRAPNMRYYGQFFFLINQKGGYIDVASIVITVGSDLFNALTPADSWKKYEALINKLKYENKYSQAITNEFQAKLKQLALDKQFFADLLKALHGGKQETLNFLLAGLYRRVITADADTTYRPALAAEDGAEPQWQVESTVQHGFGFCPVVWYRFMAGCGTVAEIDGTAIHAKLTDEVTAHDFAVSQRHRATMSTLDPILVEIGVDEDEQPAPLGAMASSPYMTPDMQAAEAANARYRLPRTGPVKSGRKRAPGMAYQYRDSEATVEMLTLPGDAMKAGTDNAQDIEAKLAESLHWVPIDPKTLQASAQMSGRAIEWLHKKQIEFCNEVRTDAEQHLLLPIVDMLLRMALSLSRRTDVALYLSGLADAAPVLASFERPAADGSQRWMPPPVEAHWPAYFPPTEPDEKATGEAVRADLKAGLITLRTAVEKRAAYYGVGNVDQYVEALEGREAERVAAEHDAAMVLGAPAMGPPVDAPPPPTKPARPARPQAAQPTQRRPIGPLLARAPRLAAA